MRLSNRETVARRAAESSGVRPGCPSPPETAVRTPEKMSVGSAAGESAPRPPPPSPVSASLLAKLMSEGSDERKLPPGSGAGGRNDGRKGCRATSGSRSMARVMYAVRAKPPSAGSTPGPLKPWARACNAEAQAGSIASPGRDRAVEASMPGVALTGIGASVAAASDAATGPPVSSARATREPRRNGQRIPIATLLPPPSAPAWLSVRRQPRLRRTVPAAVSTIARVVPVGSHVVTSLSLRGSGRRVRRTRLTSAIVRYCTSAQPISRDRHR